LDFRLGIYIDHPRGRNKVFDLNLPPPGGGVRAWISYVLDVWGCFLYLYWSFLDFVPIWDWFGMAGRPRSRPWGFDSGPGEGGFGGGPGGPQTLYKNIHFL
jgi:hypothetical protein